MYIRTEAAVYSVTVALSSGLELVALLSLLFMYLWLKCACKVVICTPYKFLMLMLAPVPFLGTHCI